MIRWRTELPHLACLAGLFIAAAALWPVAPEKMPVHWNLYGEVDRYGSRAEGLLLIPAIAVGLYALMLFLPRVDPHRENYEKFEPTYRRVRWMLTAFLAAVYIIVLTSTFNPAFDGVFAGSLLVGLLFAALGNTFGKLRTNWFLGIRTPWTLTSKRSWAKTHRVGGWLFVLLGALIALTGYTRSAPLLIVTLIVLVLGLIGLIVYSYIVWKNDPEVSSTN